MKRVFLKKFLIVTLGFALSALYMPRLSADENTAETGDTIDMVVGDVQTVPVNNLTRVSVTNPDVADISDAQSDKVTLLAKKGGATVLFLWDADGKHNIKVRVANEDLDALKARVQKILDEANITGVSLEENLDLGKVVLSGQLSKDDKNRMGDVLGPYSDNVMDLVKELKDEELIQVDMEIVEISTTLEKQLGISWTTSATYGETLPTFAGNSINNIFKVGNIYRQTPLAATVTALLQEGKARLISKPRLVVVNGKQASFLVGGEIPIASTTVSTTGSTLTSNTTYSQYGVNVSVTPTIREGKIDVLLNVDIRDIDNSSDGLSSNGNVAFITRTASTDLFLENKQTVALAGLIKVEDSATKNEVPFLGKIPILGLLFRSTNIPGNTSTETVIILTPTVLTNKKFADKEVSMPTPAEKAAWDEAIESKYPHEPLPNWSETKGQAVTPSPDVLPVMTAYARMVQERISRALAYPQAMGNDLAGTVKLKLHILKDGSLDSEEVVESSGNDILDKDAMQAAKTAAPYDAFTTGMDQEDMVFTVPIVYNRFISGEQAPTDKVIASY